MKKQKNENTLIVGLIQTTLNHHSAWYSHEKNAAPQINKYEEYEARRELREGFRQLTRCQQKPQIIITPELSIPRGFTRELQRHACTLGAICISGVDYLIENNNNHAVKNEIQIIIPDRWPYKNYNNKTFKISIFKSNASPKEKIKLKNRSFTMLSDRRLWLFEAYPYGCFGVANCYDFLDVEMHLLYKCKIQHLFVLSYNRDITSFLHTAESLCRTLYCNVIICNTGYYGGSVCVAPYHEPHKRILYKQEGNELFSAQIIKLPVKEIIEQLQRTKNHKELKSLPPGCNTNQEELNLPLII